MIFNGYELFCSFYPFRDLRTIVGGWPEEVQAGCPLKTTRRFVKNRRYGCLFLMTDAALGEFWFVFGVAVFTKGMGGILEGVDLFGHAGLAVVTGLAFFNFLPLNVRNLFAVRSLAVVAGAAFQPCLVCSMRKLGGLWRSRGINRGLQGYLCRSFIHGTGGTRKPNGTATKQGGAEQQHFFHITSPSFILYTTKKLQQVR